MANTDVNYLNPSAFKPQIGWQPVGALAGGMWNQGANEYQALLAQQMRMQELAEQERRYDFAEKQAGGPLREAERGLKMENVLGQMPTARSLADMTGQANQAEQQVKKETLLDPATLNANLSKLRQQVSDDQWKQFGREQSVVGDLMNKALALGPVAGVEFMQNSISQLRRQGINLPDYMADPKHWNALRQASIASIEQIQKLDQIQKKGDVDLASDRVKGDYAVKVAEIGANARRDSAAMTSNRDKIPPTPEARVNEIERQLSSLKGEELKQAIIQEAVPAWSNLYDVEISKKMTPGAIMSEEIKKKVMADKIKFIDGKIRHYTGFQEDYDANGNPIKGGGSSAAKRKPLGAFD